MTQTGEPKVREVDLASFLHDTVEPHRELASASGLTVETGTVESCTSPPRFDPSQMQRALDNLILNAIQNTPAGGCIVVDALHRDSHLVLRVTDTGIGVNDDIRARLFEPFATARPDGTGLGLAIVREIARAHRGDVHLAPSTSGARFEIELPIELPWQMS
jgi:signal transduction histidine kinase